MIDISCNTCMDLMPLVKDRVASDDSLLLVEEHIKTCNTCALAWNEKVQLDTSFDSEKVTKKIKKQLQLIIISIIILSTLFGVSLSISENMFFNIILMPTIGAISYIFLKNKAFYIVAFVLIVSFAWHFIISYSEYTMLIGGLFGSLWWAIIYSALCVLGIVIGFLLYFAFRKEAAYEKIS